MSGGAVSQGWWRSRPDASVALAGAALESCLPSHLGLAPIRGRRQSEVSELDRVVGESRGSLGGPRLLRLHGKVIAECGRVARAADQAVEVAEWRRRRSGGSTHFSLLQLLRR